jgi:hypothetical protein
MLAGKPEGNTSLERLWRRCKNMRIILKWILMDVDWIHLAQGWVQWRVLGNTVINVGEFLNQLSDNQFLKKDSA